MSIVFGLAKYKGVAAGLRVQSVTYGESASTAEAVDEDGNIEQTDVHSKKKTIQIEANVTDEANMGAITVGGELVVNGDTYKIDNVSIKEANNAHKTVSISGSCPIKSAPTA